MEFDRRSQLHRQFAYGERTANRLDGRARGQQGKPGPRQAVTQESSPQTVDEIQRLLLVDPEGALTQLRPGFPDAFESRMAGHLWHLEPALRKIAYRRQPESEAN